MIVEEEKKEDDSFVEVQIVHRPGSNSPEKYQTLDELMEREEASAIKIEGNPASKKIGFFK